MAAICAKVFLMLVNGLVMGPRSARSGRSRLALTSRRHVDYGRVRSALCPASWLEFRELATGTNPLGPRAREAAGTFFSDIDVTLGTRVSGVSACSPRSLALPGLTWTGAAAHLEW